MVFTSNKARPKILERQENQKNTVNAGIYPGEH